ncbi:MAG: hypothetical protein LAN64_08055 [Acidobacteriia bacterium]|nr:hypothetical protein [Terriglobia bacterium]
MKRIVICLCMLLLAGLPAMATALGTSARTVIPSDIQQIISVDYRALKNSPTAQALKARVLPEQLKEFESSLRGVGINPDTDVEQLTFASFRSKSGVEIIGLAQGTFPTKKILARIKAKKVKALKYRTSDLWSMPGGQQMTFLDDSTMLFGQRAAVQSALDSRDGEAPALNGNSTIADMIQAVDSGPVWSVLDAQGTQNMLHSTLGDAAKLADYEVVRKRLLGSRYTMEFNNGVSFNLSVLTSDSMTAATLSSLIQAGVLFRKMNAQGVEKAALDSVTVNSDSANLKLNFKSDEAKFRSLVQSDLFASVIK